MQLENIIAIAKFAKLSSCLWERPLVGKLQYRGLQPLYEGLERGGSSVEEGTACRSAFWFVFGGDGVDGHHYW